MLGSSEALQRWVGQSLHDGTILEYVAAWLVKITVELGTSIVVAIVLTPLVTTFTPISQIALALGVETSSAVLIAIVIGFYTQAVNCSFGIPPDSES